MKGQGSVEMIRGQLEFFERQTRRTKLTGDATALRLEVGISLCLRLHEMIEDLETGWGERVDGGEIEYTEEGAEEIQGLYATWLKGAKRILPVLKRTEAKGRRLALAQRLKDAIGFCYQPKINIRRTNRDFERLERGEGVRITEDGHGVRRRRAG